MPALLSTRFSARGTWLGCVVDRAVGLESVALDRVELGWGGDEFEAHGGVTRESCSRVMGLHPKGTEIRNVRQISIVSAEDLAAIAEEIGLEEVRPEWLGASMVVEGLADFTHLPPSSRLQAPGGTTLVIDMENRPCIYPGKVIEAAHSGRGPGQDAGNGSGPGKVFMGAARGRRGVTAWVERPGQVRLGDTLRLHVPDQPAWVHMGAARGL
ncbi:MAG: sulfurase [Rhodobacterales bacterium]|nr:MAG: sulfurase [Rhodobacterales bacterium]